MEFKNTFIFWDNCQIEKDSKDRIQYQTFKQDDIIEMKINTKLKACAFKINDEWREFDNIITDWTKQYHLTVTFWEPTDSVRIMNFTEYSAWTDLV